jgi:hypothetical protein
MGVLAVEMKSGAIRCEASETVDLIEVARYRSKTVKSTDSLIYHLRVIILRASASQ